MTLLKKKQFEELSKKRSKYCISMYIPTRRSGENKDSIIRLKNQLTNVESQLSELGLKPKEIFTLVKPINNLLNSSGFWRHLSDSLIILRDKEDFSYTTLPLKVEELSMVSDRYYLLPLLSTFNNNDTFFILTLSMNKNRLYEATQHGLSQIVTDDILPNNIKDSSGFDVKQKSLQFRSGHAKGGLGLFHGKGEGKDDKKTEIIKYLAEIDKGLKELLEGYTSPLIVASVDYIFSLFQEVSSCKNIYPKAISGNYDNEDILKVHEKACELLTPYFNELRIKKRNKYSEKINRTTSDIDELINAALAGGIETLFVKKHEQVWGDVKQDSGLVTINHDKKPLDKCLLDMAARSTFLKGGRVFIEEPNELPEPESAANAILRY
jgi:hypothetical protein